MNMNSTEIFKRVLEMQNYGMVNGQANIAEIQMLYIDLATQMGVSLDKIEPNVITTDEVYKEPRGLAMVGNYFNQMKEMQKTNNNAIGMTK